MAPAYTQIPTANPNCSPELLLHKSKPKPSTAHQCTMHPVQFGPEPAYAQQGETAGLDHAASPLEFRKRLISGHPSTSPQVLPLPGGGERRLPALRPCGGREGNSIVWVAKR